MLANMSGATIEAGGHYPPPCKGAVDMGSKFIGYILRACAKIYFTRLINDVFHFLTDYSVQPVCMVSSSVNHIARIMSNVN